MKLSDRTINILKNFSVIHESIVISPGNFIYTSRMGSLAAWFNSEETFEKQIAIYKLANFIAVVDRIECPDIQIEDNFAVIKGKKTKTKYKYVDPKNIQFGAKQKFMEVDMRNNSLFKHLGSITSEDLTNLKKMSSIMALEMLELNINSGKAILKATKQLDKDGNTFEVGVNKSLDIKDTKSSVRMSNMLMINDDYDLFLYPDKALTFEGKTHKVKYLVPFEVAPRNNSTNL